MFRLDPFLKGLFYCKEGLFISYIYKIINQINGKLYIGKTENTIEKRFSEHLHDAKRKRCEKRPLYSAINKYGEENFFIELIEEVPTEKSCEREIYWIKTLKTYVGFKDCNGYNATLGGDSKKYKEYNISDLIKMYEETHNIKYISECYNMDYSHVAKLLKANGVHLLSASEVKIIKNPNRIYQVDMSTYEIINRFNTTTEVNISLGKNKGNGAIRDALNARRGHHRAYGYLWYYKNDYLESINEKSVA